MVDTANPKTEHLVQQSEYAPLYNYLRYLESDRWLTSFEEIEAILGCKLPRSARTDPVWWVNRLEPHSVSQALAWGAAGWFAFDVDLENETIGFRRRYPNVYDDKPKSTLSLDEVWPVHRCGEWPEDLDLSRDTIYNHRA